MDSATLAHLLRSDLLPLSYVPEKPVRLNRELLRYRASLVKIQPGIKNKMHTIYGGGTWSSYLLLPIVPPKA